MGEWKKSYDNLLKQSPEGLSSTPSVTLLQQILREGWQDVDDRYKPIAWQVTVPPQYLNIYGRQEACSSLLRQIEALISRMSCADSA